MALQSVRMIVRYPTAAIGYGETIENVLKRARRKANDTAGELFTDTDPVKAAYRGMVEIARVSKRWQGDVIIPAIVNITKYPQPANFFGLQGLPWFKGTPIETTSISDLQGWNDWNSNTGEPTMLAMLSDDQECQVWPKPQTAGPTYFFNDATNELEDSSAATLHTGTSDNYVSTWGGGTYIIEGTDFTSADVIEAQVDNTNETLRMRFWTAPWHTSFTRDTQINREYANVLVHYLVWEMLDGSEDPDDIAKADAAEIRWRTFLEREAQTAQMDTVFPMGDIQIGYPCDEE